MSTPSPYATYGDRLGELPPELLVEFPQFGAAGPLEVTAAEEDPATQRAIQAKAQDFFLAAKHDMNLFAAICTPELAIYAYPERYQAIWQWLLTYAYQKRTFPRLALGLPRGFSKTTVLQLFIAYSVAYTEKQYVVIFAALPDLAHKVLGGAWAIINSPNFQAIYGVPKIKHERQDEVQFWLRDRLIILQARSAGTSIRGTNVEGVRPDLIIFDDIQKREDSKSQTLADALKDWFQNTALKLRSPFGCMYVFLGNMYPTEHSLLRWLCRQPAWVKFITGAILSDGTSLWEQLFPVKQLLEEYQADCDAGMKSSFMAELMNDENASLNTSLDTTKITAYTNPYGLAAEGKFIIIDPSTGKANKDAVGIGQCGIYEGKPYLERLRVGAFSPGDTIKEALTLAMETGTRLIVVEAVAYQETLLYWFERFAQELGLHNSLIFVPIHPGSSSKNSRIVDMFRGWMAGELGVCSESWNAALAQATSFDPRRGDNTDEILDILHYMPKVQALFGELLAEMLMEDLNATPVLPQLPVTACSPF